MELITKEGLLKKLIYTYKINFPKNTQFFDGTYSNDILKRLESENPLTEEKAIDILGSKSWTSNICDECNKDSHASVQLGEVLSRESRTANICFYCLNKAYEKRF